jgi:hypothetical protein
MANQDVPGLSVKPQAIWRSPPAVIIHGLEDARAALAPGLPVTLLSAPGAGAVGGALWWRALMRLARPGEADGPDILDCGTDAGAALAALRAGQRVLVLCGATAPLVTGAAATIGALVLEKAPPALDLARRGAERHLHTWLSSAGEDGGRDSATHLG